MRDDERRILVTGGAGFVGTQLCRYIAGRDGFSFRALDLPGPRLDALADAGEIAGGNLLEEGVVETALEGCDAVIHLVVAHEYAPREAHERLTLGGLRRMIAAAESSGVRRFLFMSSIKAVRKYDGLYGEYKRKAEAVLSDADLDWTVFRPGLIYGPGEIRLSRIAEKLKAWPVFPLPGGGAYPIYPVRTEDLSAALLAALDNPATVGQAYELGTDEPVLLRDIVAMIEERIDRRRPHLSLPLGPCRALGALLQKFSPMPVLFAEQIKSMQCTVEPANTGPAKKDLGFSTPDFAEGLDALVKTW
ncbi:MAG: NAD-dependent epimerase/dehydratase family protein [Planctomycetota bacterium]|jgi:NADH dehydrogenase